jgi:hypothetical protein
VLKSSDYGKKYEPGVAAGIARKQFLPAVTTPERIKEINDDCSI